MEINGFENDWEGLTSGEKAMFQKCVRILLKKTFVVYDKDEEGKKEYFFISKRADIFSRYLAPIGYDVVVDRDNKIIMLHNTVSAGESSKMQINRCNLSLADSIVLCVLFTLYADRVRTGSLAESIIVTITDLRFQFEKYQVQDRIDKKGILTESLKKLEKYNLIEMDGRLGEADARIKIFPSIQFALSSNEFHSFAQQAVERMFIKDLQNAEVELENEDGEDIDEADE